jgi:outer membrane protein assembly factor BamB/orotate phosphoribosyltransferase
VTRNTSAALAEIRLLPEWEILRRQIIERAVGFSDSVVFDFRLLLTDAYLCEIAGRLLWQLLRPFQPAVLVGPGFGAAPLLYSIAFAALKDKTSLSVLMVRDKRKGHHQKKWVEGQQHPSGIRAVMIDDFMESGSALPLVERALAADGYELNLTAIGLFFDMWAPLGSRQISVSRFPVVALFSRHDIGLSRDCFDAAPPLMKGSYPDFINAKPLWWKFSLNEKQDYLLKSSPVIGNNALFVADDNCRVWRFNIETGDTQWCYESLSNATKGIVQDLQYAEDSVVFGCYDGTITRLDAVTGSVIWRWRQDSSVHATPALDLANGRLFINTEQWNDGEPCGHLYALDWVTGKALWKLAHPWWPPASPAFDAETNILVAACNDQTLVAVNAEDGATLWSRPTKGLVRGKPAVLAGRVVVATENGEITCFDIRSGNLLWSRRYGFGAMHQFLQVASTPERDVVIVMDAKWHLIAFSLEGGAICWMSRLRSAGTWRAVECGAYLAVLSHDGHLALFDPVKEIKVWESHIGGAYRQPPAIGTFINRVGKSQMVLAAVSNDSGLKVFVVADAYIAPTVKSNERKTSVRLSTPFNFNAGEINYRSSKEPTTQYFEDRRESVINASATTRTIKKIRCFGPLDKATFRSLAEDGLPFVLNGLAGSWPLSTYCPEKLANEFGKVHVKAQLTSQDEKNLSDDTSLVEITLKSYFDFLRTPVAGSPARLANQEIVELSALCEWPSYFENVTTTKICLVPVETITPLHCDYDDHFFAQLWGTQQLILYPPHAASQLYVTETRPVLFRSGFNPESPDFETYPLAKTLPSEIHFQISAGSILYLPAGWFHYAKSNSLSLSAKCWSQSRPNVLGKQSKWNSL